MTEIWPWPEGVEQVARLEMTHTALTFDGPGSVASALSDTLKPIVSAKGLPNACYVDPAIIDIERRQVFTGGWACAGFAHDTPGSGDLFPFEFADLPLLQVRDKAGEVQVFHNVCRHRGHILVTEPTRSKRAVVCPYHGWSYDLGGQLKGTPHVGGMGQHTCPEFDVENIRLKQVRSAEWFGLVFVDLSVEVSDFADFIRPAGERWQAFENVDLVHTGTDCSIQFDLACNWKLAVENYCEAYHLPWVHPGLNSYSPLDAHEAIIEPSFSGQQSANYTPEFPAGQPAFPDAPGLSSFWQTGAEYLSLFPNVLLGIHRDHFYAGIIQPQGAGRIIERFEIFYFDDAVRGPEFEASRASNRALWETIFAEDRGVVENMQKGRTSPGFDGGTFSPVMDAPTHAFHKWIASAMLYGRSSTRAAAE
jgi:choline monooxygenase